MKENYIDNGEMKDFQLQMSDLVFAPFVLNQMMDKM